MPPKFRAAKQSRIFQDVVEQIQEAIISGELKKGERLPSERELREMLHTSRSTIREALRVLEQKGLIEIKLGMGGGSVVRSVTTDQVTESLDLMIRSQKVSLKHLAEFRERIEGDVVALAARRIDDESARHLEKLLDTAKSCVDLGELHVDDFLRADRKLHLFFAQITRNPIYISISKTIHSNINRYFEDFLDMKYPEMMENYQDLCGIVSAIQKGEPEKARDLARFHVRRFNKIMEQREGDDA